MARLGEVGDGRLDDLQEGGELLLGAAQVVGGEQPERDVLDAGVAAPLEQLLDLVGAGLVAARRAGPAGPRPAAVAVEHDGHVARERLLGEVLEDSALVRAVDHVAPPPRGLLVDSPVIVGQVRAAARAAPRSAAVPPVAVGAHGGAGAATYASVTYGCVGYARHEHRSDPDPGGDGDAAPGRPTSSPSVKPRLRGWLHLADVPRRLVGGPRPRVVFAARARAHGSLVFTVSAALLFGVSAVYHRGTWGPRGGPAQAPRPLEHLPHHRRHLHALRGHPAARRPGATAAIGHLGRRLAGCSSASSGSARRAGSTPRSTSPSAGPRSSTSCRSGDGGPLIGSLIGLGGLLYTAGGIVYGPKRPNPWPRWFGFHEVFHAFTLGVPRSPMSFAGRASAACWPRAWSKMRVRRASKSTSCARS